LADLTLIVAGVLLAALIAATTYAAIEYYKQLRKTQKEYEKARNSVEDIVLSFNRELKREADRIESVNYKVELTSSKADAGLKRAENVENRIVPLESQVSQFSTQINTISSIMESITDSNTKTLEKISNVDIDSVSNKMQDIEVSQEALKIKITGLEEQMQKLSIIPEALIETALPVMPIKRDKALATLTVTEVTVLEFLSAEGPKTAPEIKEKVQLSREHTARLMKKLYEEGYLERETCKLPFNYSVKKEMEKFLKKPESPAT
jgi:chromosome segregation ATPase